jgi:hypothetical protein
VPSLPSQSVVMEALIAADLGWKHWAHELGTHVPTLSQWAHEVRPMPEASRHAAMAALARVRPDLAADVWRAFLAPMGLTVEIAARPVVGSSRTAVAEFGMEAAEVAMAAARADADGRRDANELKRLLTEQREANAKGEEAEAALVRDLMAAEEAEAQERMRFGGGRAELVNK